MTTVVEPTWLTLEQASIYTGWSKQHLLRAMHVRLPGVPSLPYHQNAPRCRYRLNIHDLDRWMKQQTHYGTVKGDLW